MNPKRPSSPGAASPRTLALDVMIRASLERLLDAPVGAQHSGEALLFMGNWHDAMPRLLIQDAVLEPVDKIVWQVIKLQAQSQSATSFPGYAQIARHANVSSDATVSRALAILRATRWLTLCARARDQRGLFRGSIYALHDEPLPLADTLYLDLDYMQFLLHTAEAHSHARARQIAAAVLGHLQGEIEAGEDVLEAPPIHAQRAVLQAQAFAQPVAEPALNRGLVLGARWVTTLHRAAERSELQKSKVGRDAQHSRLQETKPGPASSPPASNNQPLQISKTASTGSSSCSASEEINHTTTTTTPEPLREERVAVAVDGMLKRLRFPERLGDNDRRVAAMHLRTAPEPLRQTVLDLLDRKLKAEAQGGEKLLFPMAYLAKLCQRAQSNSLILEQSLPTQSQAEQKIEVVHQRRILDLKAQAQTAQDQVLHWTRMQKLCAKSHPDDPVPARNVRAAQARHEEVLGELRKLTDAWSSTSREM